MSGFDFTGLTKDQEDLLESGGWPVDRTNVEPKPARRDAVGLIERGLLIAIDTRRRDDFGSYLRTEYRVPEPARRAWTQHREGSR
jgi:hypothetical protein